MRKLRQGIRIEKAANGFVIEFQKERDEFNDDVKTFVATNKTELLKILDDQTEGSYHNIKEKTK